VDTLNNIIKSNNFDSMHSLSDLYQIIEGDASQTIVDYIKNNPQTIFSLVHFDMDIYKPTIDCLRLVWDRIPRGGVIIFDELNHPGHPGETIALHDFIGIGNVSLIKSQYQPHSAYLIKD
jgi:predicted O-methyltransferase YrrM